MLQYPPIYIMQRAYASGCWSTPMLSQCRIWQGKLLRWQLPSHEHLLLAGRCVRQIPASTWEQIKGLKSSTDEKKEVESSYFLQDFPVVFRFNPEVHSELTPASKNHARNNAKLPNPRDGTQPCGKSSKPCQGSCLATLVCSQWCLRHTPLWACLDGHFPSVSKATLRCFMPSNIKGLSKPLWTQYDDYHQIPFAPCWSMLVP